MNAKDIKELILTIDKSSIEEVQIEKNDIRLMISKKAKSNNGAKIVTESLESKSISKDSIDMTESNKEIGDKGSNENLVEDENIYILKSPIVGTFYEASSPDSPPFVKVGDKVEKGQVVCIVEAMKIMNEIECEVEGEITQIFVEDEDIVEYGQPLMAIRR